MLVTPVQQACGSISCLKLLGNKSFQHLLPISSNTLLPLAATQLSRHLLPEHRHLQTTLTCIRQSCTAQQGTMLWQATSCHYTELYRRSNNGCTAACPGRAQKSVGILSTARVHLSATRVHLATLQQPFWPLLLCMKMRLMGTQCLTNPALQAISARALRIVSGLSLRSTQPAGAATLLHMFLMISVLGLLSPSQ